MCPCELGGSRGVATSPKEASRMISIPHPAELPFDPTTVPYGLCGCGCGKPTKVSSQNRSTQGYVRGVANRYLAGHAGHIALENRHALLSPETRRLFSLFTPVSEGFCLCGCGERTDVALMTSARRGEYKGEPKPFLFRHSRLLPFDALYTKSEGCWVWHGGMKNGYGCYQAKHKGSTVYAHRFSFEREYGSLPEDKPCACHHCDNPPCVRPDHLFAGTALDNSRDCGNKGRLYLRREGSHKFGTAHPQAVLNPEVVLLVRIDHAGGASISSLARRCAVSRSTIRHAISGETWGHVKRPTSPPSTILLPDSIELESGTTSQS